MFLTSVFVPEAQEKDRDKTAIHLLYETRSEATLWLQDVTS